jgi:hypothetical protein
MPSRDSAFARRMTTLKRKSRVVQRTEELSMMTELGH